jgi:hypothetical protein
MQTSRAAGGGNAIPIRCSDVLTVAAAVASSVADAARAADPAGRLVYGVHISLAPTSFDCAGIYHPAHDSRRLACPADDDA